MAPYSILAGLDRGDVGARSRAETRKREDVLPPISVYRWWARRTDAVNGAIVDAASEALSRGEPLFVLDPFAGGGVIPLSALKRGHRVYAQDLDPWAARGLRAMLSLPGEEPLARARAELIASAASLCEKAYGTVFSTGELAQVTQTIRVMRSRCASCHHEHRLFPFALVTLDKRRDRGCATAKLACRQGHLFDGHAEGVQACPVCQEKVDPAATYLCNREVICPACGSVQTLESRCGGEPPCWEVVLVERSDGARRELGRPTLAEIARADETRWHPRRKLKAIRSGPETKVLTRHGFKVWSDLYPRRQQVITEQLLELCGSLFDEAAVREAVSMAVLGTVEMAGHVSRWDRFYLKAFEAMASHRFNLTTLSVEPHVLGVGRVGRGTTLQRLAAFERAARWMREQDVTDASQRSSVFCGSSENIALPDGQVDLVLTDPPYHDDVHYADLSLPFRAWSRLSTSRGRGSAVAIPHTSMISKHRRYRRVLTTIFRELRRVLSAEGRLVFSYANREPAAWINLFAALRAAGFTPVAYTILQSENELDPWRKKGRACSLDLLLELSPSPLTVFEQHRTSAQLNTVEENYLLAVGDAFLATISPPVGWEDGFVTTLKAHPFLAPSTASSNASIKIAAE